MHLDLRLTLLVTSIQLISALLVRVIQLSMVRLALVLMGVMWCPPSSSKVLASWPGPVLRCIELPERRQWRIVWIRVVAIRWGEDDTESTDNLVVEGEPASPQPSHSSAGNLGLHPPLPLPAMESFTTCAKDFIFSSPQYRLAKLNQRGDPSHLSVFFTE